MTGTMTAKHALYLAVLGGNPNLDELRKQHRSLQVRRSGKSDWLVRFKDSENWSNLEDWAANYKSSLLKQLSDLVVADMQALPPEEIVEAIPNPILLEYVSRFLDISHKNGEIYYKNEVDSLLQQKDNEERESSAESSIQEVIRTNSTSGNELKEYKTRVDRLLSEQIDYYRSRGHDFTADCMDEVRKLL